MNLCDGTTIELPFPTGITLVMDPPSSTLIVVPVEGPPGRDGAGSVLSVFGRSGSVDAEAGDYAAYYDELGAAQDAATAAADALSTAMVSEQARADAALLSEQLRAESAEALKADLAVVLLRAQNLADVLDAALARAHLGLGDIATHSVGDFVTPAQLNAAITALIDGAPGALDTLGEIVLRILSDESGAAAMLVAIATKADDTAVVHNTGTETIAGVKTFSSAPVVPDGSFAQAKVAGLVVALANLSTAISTAQATAISTAAADATTKANAAQAAAIAAAAADATTKANAAQTAAQNYSDRYAGSAAGTAGRPLAATDSTTTNARTPTAHASTHATGGTDPITPASIGAATAASVAAALSGLVSPLLLMGG